MKGFRLFLYLSLISSALLGQDCNIISKANNIAPDRLCSPLSVNWQVSYTGVNDAGSIVEIQYDWDDGTIEIKTALNSGPGLYHSNATHTYVSTGDKCNYRPKSTLIVDGDICPSSTQEQIVTVWDDDDHNGGHMHISPDIFPICYGNSADVQFQDLTQFNCVPPNEVDVPNLYTRWVQWIYGTDITMSGTPVTINGTGVSFPYSSPIITLPGPITGSGIFSDIINVSDDKLIGQYFEVTLRNWNYCNPYDDPDIPGPPIDLVNGDHPPVTTTAIIQIVPYPDATITPVDTLCLQNSPATLNAHDSGGTWSGNGVINDTFDPGLAGEGDHIIKYEITDPNNCSDFDQTTITVMPSPTITFNPIETIYIYESPFVLIASPTGGNWSGHGVINNMFDPDLAGTGKHIITYQTLPDKYGCIGIDTIHITVILPPTPIANFDPEAVGCSPLFVQFKNNSENGESYLWEFGDKTYSIEQNPSHYYYVPGNYIVKLTVTNISGQSSHLGLITVYQNPSAIFDVYPTEVLNNSQVVVFRNYSQYGVSYRWEFGDENNSIEEEPWHKYESSGMYDVTLFVTSKDGCMDSTKYHTPINVDFKTGDIKYPNAFKWNGSGPTGGYWEENQSNDNIFRPFSTNVIEYKLQIFNRWGVLIYESLDLQKGWDGYFRVNNLALQGVYVWKTFGKYADGTYFNKVGDVTFLH
jgi:PKD domain/CHU_C Type IX secretion signal domain